MAELNVKAESFTFGGATYRKGVHQVDDDAPVLEAVKGHPYISVGGVDRDAFLRDGTQTGDGYECETCGANFNRVGDVLNHREIFHGQQPHTWPNYDLAAFADKYHDVDHLAARRDHVKEQSALRRATELAPKYARVDDVEAEKEVPGAITAENVTSGYDYLEGGVSNPRQRKGSTRKVAEAPAPVEETPEEEQTPAQ